MYFSPSASFKVNLFNTRSTGLRTPMLSDMSYDWPKPGEIWGVNQQIDSVEMFPPRVLSSLFPKDMLSPPALQFTQGQAGMRYVMIVGDVHPLVNISAAPYSQSFQSVLSQPNPTQRATSLHWVAVMVLSTDLTMLSERDVLLPITLSGLENELIAETWHVVPMLVSQLLTAVGNRLSWSVYETLMSIGDRHYNLQPPHTAVTPSTPSLAASDDGAAIETTAEPTIKIGTRPTSDPSIQQFHRGEQQWSEVLRFPVLACKMHLDAFKKTTSIIDDALSLEQLLEP